MTSVLNPGRSESELWRIVRGSVDFTGKLVTEP